MRILAFDTATAATAVALADTDGALELEARDDPAPGARPGHAQRLLSLIEEVLERSGGGWEQIDRIAVGIGPGTFTGLRIGVATAHALARSTGTPLVPVSTLASLELGARRQGIDAQVLAVIDARRGEAFVAGAGLEPCVLTPEALGEATGQRAGGGVVAVGDGAIRFRELLEQHGARVPDDEDPVHRVDARVHCRIAAKIEPRAPEDVQPQYLRVPDAELNRR